MVVDQVLQVPGWPGVWSLGDCACMPTGPDGGVYPPTAQHASRRGKVLARRRGPPRSAAGASATICLQDPRSARRHRSWHRGRQHHGAQLLRLPRLVDVAHDLSDEAAAPGAQGAGRARLDARPVVHQGPRCVHLLAQLRIVIQDTYHPKEVGYFIPATTAATDKRCIKINGQDACKIAIQSNNVETDERGFIYVVDRANTGLHILEMTGPARAIAGLPEN